MLLIKFDLKRFKKDVGHVIEKAYDNAGRRNTAPFLLSHVSR